MEYSSKQLGSIYRQVLLEKLSEIHGKGRIERCWLVFSNCRYLSRYSKYHSGRDYYFFGIDKKDWVGWQKDDQLIFLLPPEGYDTVLAPEVKYIKLSPSHSSELLENSRSDTNEQKKVTVHQQNDCFYISDCSFSITNDMLDFINVSPDAPNKTQVALASIDCNTKRNSNKSARKLGVIYRKALIEQFSKSHGIGQLENCWLVFTDRRFLSLYSRFHNKANCYFYGISRKYWNEWRQNDQLVLLLPPDAPDGEESSEIDFIELSPRYSKELIDNIGLSEDEQKKVKIYLKSNYYEIRNCSFSITEDMVGHIRLANRENKKSCCEDGLKAKIVYKQISENGPQPTKSKEKYSRLHSFLSNIHPDQKQIRLTFEELTEFGKIKLPQSAYKKNNWWNISMKKKLSDLGWTLEAVYTNARVLILKRKGSNDRRDIKDLVEKILEGIPIITKPGPYQIKSWINYCRRIEMFFEGTVLYEKTGLDMEVFCDVEIQEIEEDYQVCKREISRTINSQFDMTTI